MNADIVKIKKNVQKKRYLRVINLLKKYFNATIIIKQTLNIKIVLRIDRL